MSDVSQAIFLSYASQDAEAAQRIAEALRAADVEVWLDQSELVGGDAWDAKIRGQIASCALFLPVISANTQARREGYFRLEWKLAAQRSHMISERTAFLLPVVIDATRDAEADVPAEFRAVQWTRLAGGEASAAFCGRVSALLGGTQRMEMGRPRPVERGEGAASQIKRHQARPWRSLAFLSIAVAIALAIWLPSRPVAPTASANPEPKTQNPKPIDLPSDKSIAVLPFANLPDDKNTEYFSDGLTEEILNALASDRSLRVAARTSAFAFKGKATAVEDIGRALKVARVIEGSVRKDGSQVRITVKLINAANGYQEWSDQFNAEMTNIFALQSEIAGKIAQRLGGASASATPAKTPPAPTTNLAAYDLYLRARALQTAPTAATVQLEAAKLYEEALRLDPDYAMASARLAQLLANSITGGFDRSESLATRAATAAATALRLAPQLPEAHLAIAYVRLQLDHDHEAAQRALNDLVRLAPNHAEAHVALANLELYRGNWSETLVRFAARATELDPQNAAALNRLAVFLSTIGQFAEADRLALRSWELSKSGSQAIRRRASNWVAWTGDAGRALELLDSAPPDLKDSSLFLQMRARLHAMRGDVNAALADYERTKAVLIGQNTSGPRGGDLSASHHLARLEASRGRTAPAAVHLDESFRLAQRYIADFPELVTGWSHLARIEAARGKKEAAMAALDEAMRRQTRTRDASMMAITRQNKAEVLTILGDKAAAIAELRAVHDMGYGFGYTLRLEPEWAPLRSEPAFQRLMAEAEARAKAQPRPKK
jgi:TolB-like protein/Tfp pilus assembly protein PilF